jgi:tetratricopeptide (TPR) repeat protein
MQTKPIHLAVLFASSIFAMVCAQAQTAIPQQTLQQYVADLQSNPNDAALRGKIIALAQTMRPAPAIPEEAREHYVMAATFMESAKDPAGFARAVEQYKAALLVAPWWADAYKKLAIAQKAAAQYDDAIASLNFYLASQPADARDAQDEIYKIKALKQAAADEIATRQRAVDAERQRQEEEQARKAREQEDFVRSLDGAEYTRSTVQPSTGDDGVRRQLVYTEKLVVQGHTIKELSLPPTGRVFDYGFRLTIDGRTIRGYEKTAGWTGTISDDRVTLSINGLPDVVFNRIR